MTVHVFVVKDPRITRFVQKAGSREPLTWLSGICVRIPGGRALLVDYWWSPRKRRGA